MIAVVLRIRTLIAHLVTCHHIGPKTLEVQVQAWAWLCKQAETVDEKIECMES